MESISCVVLGTSMLHRQFPCLQTLQSIDNNNKGLFKEKIVSIDKVPGQPIDAQLMHYIRLNDWRLISEPLRKSMDAQRHLLIEAKGDWVFYSEDDVKLTRIPTKEEFCWMNHVSFEGKIPGMIAYMHGGYQWHRKQEITDNVRNPANYAHKNPECVLWHRDYKLASEFFWEFPVTMVRRSIFLEANFHAAFNYKGVHSETALSNAWRDFNLQEWFYKATFMRDPTGFKSTSELTDEDVNGLFLHKCLHVKTFGNDANQRAIPPTNGISMSF